MTLIPSTCHSETAAMKACEVLRCDTRPSNTLAKAEGPDDSLPPLTLTLRLRVFARLLFSLRRHDFRSARQFMSLTFPDDPPVARVVRFVVWALRQMWCTIPDAMRHTRFVDKVSKVPVWLRDGNPLADHPWAAQPDSQLPAVADTVVIGCGLAGCATAYHWGKKTPPDRKLVALDMGDTATGSAGRNEGLVVMGRYYYMVVQTVLPWLRQVRHDLTAQQQEQLARQFAARYAHACYHNGDLIEKTVREERFDCDYVREGWVQQREAYEQASLTASVQMALDTGYTDWTTITPEEVRRRTGMIVRHNAGFSIAAASFHPAKWCWSLLKRAMQSDKVEHYSRTWVHGISDAAEEYVIRTARGDIRARHVVLCTESYTPLLMPQFHDVIRPTQTQAASGPGGLPTMKPHVGISGAPAFFGRYGDETMIGSDATRLPDREAGRIQPSRFLTHHLCTELQKAYGRLPTPLPTNGRVRSHTRPTSIPWSGPSTANVSTSSAAWPVPAGPFPPTAAAVLQTESWANRSEPDDYPEAYFNPMRLLDPARHDWAKVEENGDRRKQK